MTFSSARAWKRRSSGRKGTRPCKWAPSKSARSMGTSPRKASPLPAPGKRRYMMLVCTDPTVDVDQLGPIPPVDPWVDQVDGIGARRFGSQLDDPARARTVRARDAQVLVTDGPFAETKEQIAGFDILDCNDLDEAIEIAREHPMARYGILEIRPFWPDQED